MHIHTNMEVFVTKIKCHILQNSPHMPPPPNLLVFGTNTLFCAKEVAMVIYLFLIKHLKAYKKGEEIYMNICQTFHFVRLTVEVCISNSQSSLSSATVNSSDRRAEEEELSVLVLFTINLGTTSQ